MSLLQWISGSVFFLCLLTIGIYFTGLNKADPDSGLDNILHPADRYIPISKKKALFTTILAIITVLSFLAFISSF